MILSTAETFSVKDAVKAASYRDIIEPSYYRLLSIKQLITVCLVFFGMAILAIWWAVLSKLNQKT
jgi:hypothetical protein